MDSQAGLVTPPADGVPLVYVCEQNTREIVDMDPAEGQALLDEVFDHVYAPANVWDHDWQLHDLALWDNLAIQHARPNVPPTGQSAPCARWPRRCPRSSRTRSPSTQRPLTGTSSKVVLRGASW